MPLPAKYRSRVDKVRRRFRSTSSSPRLTYAVRIHGMSSTAADAGAGDQESILSNRPGSDSGFRFSTGFAGNPGAGCPSIKTGHLDDSRREFGQGRGPLYHPIRARFSK
jgi:hypothetical protein